jgi:phenylacetate-CoA ligase
VAKIDFHWAPRSAVSGVVWPGLPGPLDALFFALLAQLERSQWWSADELREHQFAQLRPLLAHAYQTVPFYRRRFEDAGVDPERITPESWASLPLLTRTDLQTAGDTLKSIQVPADHGTLSVKHSSGSTGMPVSVVVTALTHLFWTACNARDHLWHRHRLNDKLAAIRDTRGLHADYPDGATFRAWGEAPAILGASGPAAVLSIATPVSQQLEWLARQHADYLLTYPSNLAELIRLSVERQVALPTLRGVLSISEVLRPELREACRRAWGLPITDNYSANELGYLALQCPEHEHYHVQSEVALLEVLDDAGRPCAVGEVGNVVLTSLHNYAMPLIRYAIQDFAEVGPPCPCGRGLPVLRRVVGRSRNLLTLPNGEKCFPVFSELRFAEIAPVRQCQIVQRSREELELRLIVARELTPAEEEKMREVTCRYLGKFRIVFAYPTEIPRGAGGKFEDFLSEIVK